MEIGDGPCGPGGKGATETAGQSDSDRGLSSKTWRNVGRTVASMAPRSADFRVCCVADFQSASAGKFTACRLAAVAPKRRFGAPRRRKVGDTAGWKPSETCATSPV